MNSYRSIERLLAVLVFGYLEFITMAQRDILRWKAKSKACDDGFSVHYCDAASKTSLPLAVAFPDILNDLFRIYMYC